ncbi:transcription factor IIIC subunit delta N-term-domain-containing protein [Ganoderma leucocontextum]|nr:transcription factor IIIC subunit delta N-term-domain-containing protein [Ganoderma leucocontextum]
MTELPLPTVLSLPAVSGSPSVRGLQFSQDGQLVLLTKYAIYILTPDAGVNVELSSVIKQTLDSKPSTHSATRPLGWLRTMVEFDRSLAHQWPADCTDWGAVSLGSLDPSLQAVALSPSNLTTDAACVFALLNSNLELTIWGATKNSLTGEWIKLQDVTSSLKLVPVSRPQRSAFKETLQLQSTCLDWSSQPSWNLTPAPRIDASLLAVGDRAGCVTFLRYGRSDRHMIPVDEVQVSDRWVTHLAWSPWLLSQDGTCEAMLACGISDGSVTILVVRQTLTSKPGTTRFVPTRDLGLKVEAHDEKVCDSDGRAITGMRWANVTGRTPILIFHKAAVLLLWSTSSVRSAWSGSRSLLLPTQKRSVGSSALSPSSGVSYIPDRDICVVSLSDGSFHVIHSLSANPTLDPPPSEGVSSQTLSAVSRAFFARAEPEKVSLKDVDRINGMTTYDGRATCIWTYEAYRPTDFSYKHDAKHISTLLVAQLWHENIDNRVVADLAESVGRATSSGETPISILRPIFLHLRDPARVSRLHTDVLDVLYQVPPDGARANIDIPPYAGDWTADVSREWRESLTTHLFGWDIILSQRIRYAVAIFCQRRAEAPDVQQKFAEAASLLLTNVRTHVQLTLLRHISAISGLLNHSDISFARRIIHQTATTGAPPALAKEAEMLLALLARSAPHPEPIHASATSTAPVDSPDEPCPACGASVPLSSSETEGAVCANGHVWARCCITSYLLATPMVRTCVGCSRKAFLPPPSPLPGAVTTAFADPPHGDERGDGDQHGDAGAPPALPGAGGGGGGALSGLPSSARDSRVVRDLLDATRRCPFCGNNFVVLV